MIRVLVVEDSLTMQAALRAILESDPALRVIGTAANGEDGVRQAQKLKPDVITMDLYMPVMDGLEATRRIMEACPTPIVVVSAYADSEILPVSFQAIQAGALDVVQKPAGLGQPGFPGARERLISTVKLMSEVKVIRRRGRRAADLPPGEAHDTAPGFAAGPARRDFRVVAIGASTGGPAALNQLLGALPRGFAAPVVVVQHMTAGFLQGMVEWLQTTCPLPLSVVQENTHLMPGQVYFAREDRHLVFHSPDVVGLNQDAPVSHARPSATVLFRSMAEVHGVRAVGVLLTGMGDDGAAGLKAVSDRGGLTIAQDEETCVVYGMPKAAVELGAVQHLCALGRIAPMLVEAVSARHAGP